MEQVSTRTQWMLKQIQGYLPTMFGALVVLIVGIRLIRLLMKIVGKAFDKGKVDTTVSRFLTSLIGIGLKVLLLLSVAGMFGVKTTSFIALLGAAGLAVGLSLQGSLSNFAGGVIILLFKPYRVGDLVEIQGIKGHVLEISVLSTTLITLENNHAFIPNGPIINGNIINFSKKESIRVDVKLGIAYHESIDKAREVLLAMAAKESEFLDDPAPEVLVSSLGDSSVNLIVRGYVEPEQHWPVYFRVTENAKKALNAANIEIPFPQRVVHMQK